MVDTSDYILLIVALFIFSMLQLSLNRVLLNNTRVMTTTELDYTGVSLAQNIADEARGKAFDENSTGGTGALTVPDDFSTTLGRESGEMYSSFNDFDDYHNYTRTDTTTHGIYDTFCTVDYVVESDVNQISAVNTAYKRLLVEVVSETNDTTAVTYIKSFY